MESGLRFFVFIFFYSALEFTTMKQACKVEFEVFHYLLKQTFVFPGEEAGQR